MEILTKAFSIPGRIELSATLPSKKLTRISLSSFSIPGRIELSATIERDYLYGAGFPLSVSPVGSSCLQHCLA